MPDLAILALWWGLPVAQLRDESPRDLERRLELTCARMQGIGDGALDPFEWPFSVRLDLDGFICPCNDLEVNGGWKHLEAEAAREPAAYRLRSVIHCGHEGCPF